MIYGGEFLHSNSITRGAIVSANGNKKANLTEAVSPTKSRSGINTMWKAHPE
jgi:hypothetical protein